MNYPVWDVSFGAGLLIAIVAITHVFVSHFAVGGGLFLVLTERRAYKTNDTELLGWLKRHSKFFVLVTVVFGAVSGVGIWFTIALISPFATTNLIHAYVWGWAIEWVFFFLEISAALFYLYGWEKLDRKTHLWFGWIYFINAYLSLVIINGIIAFMLTSGKWIETRQFWTGFFNPTYFPSLFFRSLICFALAGVYALLTASRERDLELKARIVKWSARWTVPSLLLIVPVGFWYVKAIPESLWLSARGPMPTATHFAMMAGTMLAVTLGLALLTMLAPRRIGTTYSIAVALVAFLAMGSFEFVREAIRKPYVIANYMYANSVYVSAMPGDGGFTVDNLNEKGVLNTARFIEHRTITPETELAAGHEIFRVECQSCHTVSAYRGLKQAFVRRQWDKARIHAIIGSLNMMHNGVMPPFGGTDAERAALAAYLHSLNNIQIQDVPVEGAKVFKNNCSSCHRADKNGVIFTTLTADASANADALKDLTAIFPMMPDLKLTDHERTALGQWIAENAIAKQPTHARLGGRR